MIMPPLAFPPNSGFPKRMRKDVIQIEVHLAHDADIVAARAVDRNDGFGGKLEVVGHVDYARIDGARRSLFSVEV